VSDKKKRALVSVSDRTGLIDFVRTLVKLDFEIISTGGTARHLADAGIPVTLAADLTGFPEVFGGRVKTLHPRLFGGILFRRDAEEHRREAEENEISPIDIVAVNLYPFEATVEKPVSLLEAIEQIDIGGPSLLRAAAKNHEHVTVISDPADYPSIAKELEANQGQTSAETRRRLAIKVFRRTAAYDAVISDWLGRQTGGEIFPERLPVAFERVQELRYGENPHQKAALYRSPVRIEGSLCTFEKLQGKELSYNNFLDADSALFAAKGLGAGGVVIVKHRIASGMAANPSIATAFAAAWESDPVAGFGGVVAVMGTIDAQTAALMTRNFLEVIVAEAVTEEALAILAKKTNLRVLAVPGLLGPATRRTEFRPIDGGLLVQELNHSLDDSSSWNLVTKRAATDEEISSLEFAFRAVRGVISNGIVVARGTATVGIGGGRTSRVDACKDAVQKAGEKARGAVAASDAFFPFPDGLEVLAQAGVTAVAQPGGSIKDNEVIEAANRLGVAMVMTGTRHFRH
jgi:phosphoribosylaminoimidazolecarboxamide formyltransferase/IMP cyclohydrolase